MIVFPQGGLGNRIRVLNSAIELSKNRNAKLYVCWVKEKNLNCDFEKVFEKGNEFEMIKYGKLNIWLLKILNKFNSKYPKLFSRLYLFHNYHFNINICKPFVISDCKKTIIWTWNKFYDYVQMHLRFNEDINNKAISICKEFTDNTIGIHIRMSDNIISIAHSPPKLFEMKMDEIITSDKNNKFFFCTDDLDVKIHFLNKFGNILITQNVVLNRNSEEGIIGAAVDILCLSKTKVIYASYFSSFSEVAAEFSSTKRVVLRNL